jgi:hypothetical protein
MTTPHIFNGTGTNVGVENAQSTICYNPSVMLQVLPAWVYLDLGRKFGGCGNFVTKNHLYLTEPVCFCKQIFWKLSFFLADALFFVPVLSLLFYFVRRKNSAFGEY